jgi:pimeloyl-ACP methyl ester carboxylesterase
MINLPGAIGSLCVAKNKFSPSITMTPFKDQFIDVGGVRTRYWQAGDQGSAVLLLHGIGCSVLEWQRNIAALARHHRVFAVDLLGFGLTDKPSDENYGIPRLAQFTLDFLTAHHISCAHLAGNSLGGSIALECARIAPQRIASQVLVDPAGVDRYGTLLEFRLATVAFLGEMLTRPNHLGTRMLWRKAFADPSQFVTDELVNTKVSLAKMPGAHAAFLKTLRSFVNFSGFRPEHVNALHAALPSISAPTLVVWGRDDQFVKVAHAEVLRRLLPNVQVEIWDHCGHAPQLELAEKFNETAIAFWRSLDAKAA